MGSMTRPECHQAPVRPERKLKQRTIFAHNFPVRAIPEYFAMNAVPPLRRRASLNTLLRTRTTRPWMAHDTQYSIFMYNFGRTNLSPLGYSSAQRRTSPPRRRGSCRMAGG